MWTLIQSLRDVLRAHGLELRMIEVLGSMLGGVRLIDVGWRVRVVLSRPGRQRVGFLLGIVLLRGILLEHVW